MVPCVFYHLTNTPQSAFFCLFVFLIRESWNKYVKMGVTLSEVKTEDLKL